jgi:DeoR/GlpR family transcriptional regulator of sugar metabolism
MSKKFKIILDFSDFFKYFLPMIPYQRRQKILDQLQKKKMCSVIELSKLLNVSEITIHRDLLNLEKDGFVTKVHGGAFLAKNTDESINKVDQSINVRLGRNVDEKREIAKKALCLIKDEISIFLDHSSTCIYLARELRFKKFQHLVVVTNSVKILDELEGHFNIHAVSTGGTLQHQWSALTGTYALDFMSRLNFEKIFVSCGAISIERGLMTSYSFVSEILKKASEVTREINLLVDSSKFSKVGTFSIIPIQKVNRIITDKNLDPNIVKKYVELGIEFII